MPAPIAALLYTLLLRAFPSRHRARYGREKRTQYEGNGRFVGMGLDFRHAVRGRTKSWTFTAVCLTSLAIGVAINAILFLFVRQTFDPPRAVKAEAPWGCSCSREVWHSTTSGRIPTSWM